MFLFFLGILDIIVGFLLGFGAGNAFTANSIILFLGIIFILKGLWSVLSAATAGFYFDLLGIFDLLSGFILVLSWFGFAHDVFFYMALIMLAKGIYSILIGIK